MSLVGQLHSRATIERPTPATSATGQVTLSWAAVATDVPCSLQTRSGALVQAGPGLQLEADLVAWFEVGADLRPQSDGGPGDRVTIDGVSYRVVHAAPAPGPRRLLRVRLERES